MAKLSLKTKELDAKFNYTATPFNSLTPKSDWFNYDDIKHHIPTGRFKGYSDGDAETHIEVWSQFGFYTIVEHFIPTNEARILS